MWRKQKKEDVEWKSLSIPGNVGMWMKCWDGFCDWGVWWNGILKDSFSFHSFHWFSCNKFFFIFRFYYFISFRFVPFLSIDLLLWIAVFLSIYNNIYLSSPSYNEQRKKNETNSEYAFQFVSIWPKIIAFFLKKNETDTKISKSFQIFRCFSSSIILCVEFLYFIKWANLYLAGCMSEKESMSIRSINRLYSLLFYFLFRSLCQRPSRLNKRNKLQHYNEKCNWLAINLLCVHLLLTHMFVWACLCAYANIYFLLIFFNLFPLKSHHQQWKWTVFFLFQKNYFSFSLVLFVLVRYYAIFRINNSGKKSANRDLGV